MPNNTSFSLIWGLLCVLVIMGLAYLFTRYVVGRGSRWMGTGGLRVVERLSLGRDLNLVVVQAGERFFLLGAGTTQVTLIAEFTEQEAQDWKMERSVCEDGKMNFAQAFETLLNRKG